MKYVTPILLALVVLPAVALGGAVWSQSNVTHTYEQRVLEIDAKIEELTTREAELNLGFAELCPERCNQSWQDKYYLRIQMQEEVAKLEEEKRILEVAYWLINSSFVETKAN